MKNKLPNFFILGTIKSYTITLWQNLKNQLFLSLKIKKLNSSGNKKILVIGDSHSKVFLDKKVYNSFKKYQMNVVTVGGATISGLTNPNSITNAKRIFEYSIKKIKPEILIFLLGEVDAGFLIWYKKENSNLLIDKIYKKSLDKYKKFILESTQKSKALKIIIISIPLPTIKKYLPGNEISNARSKIKATYQQRKDLTNKFNHDIAKFCEKNQLIFLNLTKEVTDKNGNVKNEFLNDSIFDHHYKKEKYAEIIIKKLTKKIK